MGTGTEHQAEGQCLYQHPCALGQQQTAREHL